MAISAQQRGVHIKLEIIVDAMGGDNAPEQIVKGCMDAVNAEKGFNLVIVGDEERIRAEIGKSKSVDWGRIRIIHASQTISNTDAPIKSLKEKKDSSLVVGLNLLKEGKGDAFLSAGNTGALMAGALLIVGRIKGVDRPALAPVIPTLKGKTLLIDAGSNTDCRPVNFKQFGVMGSLYMKEMFGIESPTVGLVNVGVENTKGNTTIREAHRLLSEANINFAGNIEGREIIEGKVDVVVCDGFVGNVILKTMEGTANGLFTLLKRELTKNFFRTACAMLLKKGLKSIKEKNDYREYGGAPFLGIDGVVIKCHGSSNAQAVKVAIAQAKEFVNNNIIQQLRTDFIDMEVSDIEQE